MADDGLLEEYMRLKDSLLLRELDKTLAITGVILSLILIIYMGGKSGRVIYLLVGVLALISCLLWLTIRESHTFEFHLPESRSLVVFCAICFSGLYILSVLSVYLRPELYERPLLYFILTALMAGVIACEIFTSSRKHASFILSQILLLGVSIAWSQLLIFPDLLGVDPWYHSAFTNRIIEENMIPEGYVYSHLPLFHLMVGVTSLIGGLSYKLANMVSVSLGQIICNAVFIFLIATQLFKSHRVGLLAALLVIVANHHIIMSYWSIPNAFAAVFIPIIVYLVLFRAKSNHHEVNSLFMQIIMLLLMIAIILTHSIAAMCMALLLFVAWGALTFYRIFYPRAGTYNITLLVPFGFTVIMFAWWAYVSGHVNALGQIINGGFSVDVFIETPAELISYMASVPLGEQVFNNLGMFLFFTVSFIGIFYMNSSKGNGSSFAMAWAGMTPLAVGFFSLISGHSVIESRWWYFSQIFLSIPLAVAMYIIGTWNSKKPLRVYTFVFGFVVILSFFMIMSPPANIDNHIFSPNSSSTSAPTESELKSIMTLKTKCDGTIKTDAYLAGTEVSDDPQVLDFSEDILSKRYLALRDHIIFIREATISKPFTFFSAIYKLEYNLNVKMDELGFSRIYHSSSGSGYQG